MVFYVKIITVVMNDEEGHPDLDADLFPVLKVLARDTSIRTGP